jgi:ribose transport system ATP-binding protein
VAIVYITHKLEELSHIGDDVAVMRDGRMIASTSLSDVTRDEIVRMMVGRDVIAPRQRRRSSTADEALRVDAVSLAHPTRPGDFLVDNVSLRVCKGEVVGLFGLMGAGRTELLECIFGLHPHANSGGVFIDGRQVDLQTPADAISAGLALAPEDRKRDGLVLSMSVAENASLASLRKCERFGLLNRQSEETLAEVYLDRFQVKARSFQQPIRDLSGGNQQKVILGKWLATNPKVLLLDEPTRGIDVQAKSEIYAFIDELVSEGLAVVIASSELPEILALSDRILVMCEGRLSAEFAAIEASEEAIMEAALPRSAVPAC